MSVTKPTRGRTVRTQMGKFVMVPTWVVRRVRCACPVASEVSTALHLYVVIGLYANTEKRAWPKTDELAAAMGPIVPETGVSAPVGVRTVERGIFNLRRAGALQTEKRRNGRGHVIGLEYVLVQVEPPVALHHRLAESPAADEGADYPPTQAGSETAHSAATGGMETPSHPPAQAGSDGIHSAPSGGLSEGLTACTDAPTPPGQAGRTSPVLISELDPCELDPRAAEADAAAADPCEALRRAWNDAIADVNPGTRIPAVFELTPGRRELMLRALDDRALDEWVRLFRRLAASSFCNGSGRQGWIADLWWLLGRPDAALRLEEGKYDDHFSDAELSEARRQLFNAYGSRCPHTPTCEDTDACARRHALAMRARRAS